MTESPSGDGYAPQKKGNPKYYRMSTSEQKAEQRLKFAAGFAISVMLLLIGGYIWLQISSPAKPEPAQTAAPPSFSAPESPPLPRLSDEAAPVADQSPAEPKQDPLQETAGCSLCPKEMIIPRGVFIMGLRPENAQSVASRDRVREIPPHGVSLAADIAMMQHEVSIAEFQEFARATDFTGAGCIVEDRGNGLWRVDDTASWRKPRLPLADDQPAVCISRSDAEDYAAWLSQATGFTYRLPSEAEWEYAARAGSKTLRYWGNDVAETCTYANIRGQDNRAARSALPDLAFFPCSDGFPHLAPVSFGKANAFGLHGMFGNAAEWVADCWTPHFRGAPREAEAWRSGDCQRAILRGGSWRDAPPSVRASKRVDLAEDTRRSDTGFRLVRELYASER